MRLFLYSTVLFIFLKVPGVILDHYPAKDNCKPCWRLNNTIIYQAPICTTDTNGKFTPEGLSACESFKNECPEFNKHKCLWYTQEASNKTYPCCRLKYKARRNGDLGATTWMEVYYTLQYREENGSVLINDIVEIHRKFKDSESSYLYDAVIDKKLERGLTWVNVNPASPILHRSGEPICSSQTDDRCSGDVVEYLKAHYKDGFDMGKLPQRSLAEILSKKNASVEIGNPYCIDILNEPDKTKTRACQVIYVQRFDKIMSFPFLEVNVFQSGNNAEMRYAYWNVDKEYATEHYIKDCKVRYQ